MIKRETVVSLLAGLLVGALGIAPVVAGDGLGNFGPAQGGGGGVTDAELVAIGALTPTDGNVIVGDGSTWVAESGATARASLGALGGSLGSTDNVLLRSDGTGGVTAQGSDATMTDAELLDLTATGALALGTGANDPQLAKSATDVVAVNDGSGTSSGFLAANGCEVLDVGAYTTAAGARARTPTLRAGLFGSSFGGAIVAASYKFGWSSTTAGSADVGTTDDTAISRDSAGRVLVENGSGTAADLRAAGVHYGATSGIVRTMGKQKTLTDNVATSIITISQAAGERSGGIVQWTVIADDGTDRQVRTGSFTFAAEDKSGTLVSDLDVGATESVAVSAGTLSVTPTIADGSNALSIQITADTSLTASPVIRFVFTSFCDSTVTLP